MMIKSIKVFLCVWILTNFLVVTVRAQNLIGYPNVSFQPQNYVFKGAAINNLQGVVQFENGFTLMPNGATSESGLIFDGSLPISGAIDLRGTNTLNLVRDIFFDSSVTLTDGGVFYGNGKTIQLMGNITIGDSVITSSNVFHIGNNTIIDGNGNTLIVGNNSQIFVDANVTLTLRNLTLRNKQHVFSFPPVRLASLGSKLALDNVIIDPQGDFLFPQGQLFIHNDVLFTGSSAFIYQSPMPSFITQNSSLTFDFGTTFSCAPATFTDAPFTLKNTYTDCNFIKMADQSSVLNFNGCSFLSTLTGCRLTSGMVLFDNKVNIKTLATSTINAITPLTSLGSVGTGSGPYSVSWSPDERFIAVVNKNDNTLQVYSFKGSGAPSSVGGTASTGNSPQSVSWSPDGRFIAVVNFYSYTLQVYSFNGSSTPSPVDGTVGTGFNPSVVSWSLDGRFLAVANYGGNTLQVYRFNGLSAPSSVGGAVGTGSFPNSVSWSSDGRFIAVVNYGSSTLQIYSFNGSNAPSPVGGTIGTGTQPYSASWSPDGRFIAVINSTFPGTLQVYRFNGSSAPSPVGGAAGTGNYPYSVNWSPDGGFIVVVNSASSTLQVYSFNGSSTPSLVDGTVSTGSSPQSGSWSLGGRFFAVVNYNDPSLQVFRFNYTTDSTPQALSSSLVFGKSTAGSGYDASVWLTNGASVAVKGLIKYDCIN